ncbi:hypothetical protein CVM73_18525 [Bradyrhizobium forestalis]|uniref:Uncharacterized protein n=1 Tax=Bradyrhizobium forestalis TaxID=1419263 RepID=A0A2M8R7D0_9BRAD|nr:hypothetical protein [Bradyrhizobium forestalis]PJG53735.1 hypothetical protein CVM73_18525 [Bradyrhizobium forestalis]
MDPFNTINPFAPEFSAYSAAVPQGQQQQADFEPYLDEVPQVGTSAIAEDPVSADPYYPHLSEEGLRLAETFGLEYQRADGSHPEHAVTGREDAATLMGEDYTGQLRPAKRQRTLSQTQPDAIEHQHSEPSNSAARELIEEAGTPFRVSGPLTIPEEDCIQDLLRAMLENADSSSSLEPTERHDRAVDSGAAVRSFNSWQDDQRTSGAHEGSSVPPSQDTPPAPFIVHNDRFSFTALFVPAAAMRGGSPLNLSGAPIHFGSPLDSVSQPSAQGANRPSPALLAQTMEQAAPASVRAETTPPAAREIYAASFAVPEGFSHGTQPAPITMISRLGRWGLLPDAAQPMKQYDIRGERYTALLGPGGPNDVRLIHHPQM